LSERLAAAVLPEGLWANIGSSIARIHAAGADHADLNAHNILIDEAGAVSVIDFDRGRLRGRAAAREPAAWAAANLSRLRKSLEKVSRALPGERFSALQWGYLLAGYASP
jgi:3-deoxy-D-manno-octulosonic acid kinase